MKTTYVTGDIVYHIKLGKCEIINPVPEHGHLKVKSKRTGTFHLVDEVDLTTYGNSLSWKMFFIMLLAMTLTILFNYLLQKF